MAQREIKFRAWDQATGKMVDPDKVYLNGSVVISSTWATDDVRLMQFTGLKDKNGVEIYECDIMSPYRQIVKWTYGEESQAPYPGWLMFSQDRKGFDDIRGEVIGNIYENPELLER